MFTWGDTVLIKSTAPAEYRPNEIGDVVGITTVEKESQVAVFGEVIGTVLYTVEFGDGTDVLVPDRYVEAYPL